MEISQLIEAQRRFVRGGGTRSLAFRELMLDALARGIRDMEPEIHAALAADLGKSAFEAYMCETGMVLSEIRYMKAHLRKFAAPRRVRTPMAQFPARSYVLKEPYGCVLIMSPWNYPFMLTLEPLVDALAAGNTAILKPSAYSPATSALLQRLVSQVFPRELVAVVEGGREENQQLLEQKFDYIFFTGGTAVGRLVLQKAARHFTPVTLEMGGKSPCIVDETADLSVAAKRIAFGKYLNCGQTCVAPDYLLIHRSVMERFLPLLYQAIRDMYGDDPLQSPDYGRIVNRRHYDRITEILDGEALLFGGQRSPDTLQIAPAVVGPVSPEGPAMGQELFAPILPVLPYENLRQAVDFIASRPKPLALYLFSRNPGTIGYVQSSLSFGGGCVNDTIIHLATSEMGFGGVGMSGMGSYHGRQGFDTFTHEKSMVRKGCWLDIPLRYPKYTPGKERLLRWFLR